MIMKAFILALVVPVLAAATAACTKAESEKSAAPTQAAISEGDAAKVADSTVDVWKSMDAARIKALYAPSVEAYDFAVPALAKDRAEFDKRQDAYAAAKLDGAKQVERKIQILTPDVFVMNGTWDMTSSALPANNTMVRCTDVFQKDSSGNWLIVDEHCSAAPKAA
jgi:hypothetical protein